MFHLRLGQNVLWLHKKLLHNFHALFYVFFFDIIIFVLSEKRCVRLLLIYLMFLKLSKLARQYFFLIVCCIILSISTTKFIICLCQSFRNNFCFVSFHISLISIWFNVSIFRAENLEFFMYEIVSRPKTLMP